MRTASTQLKDFLAGARFGDVAFAMADLFTIGLIGGSTVYLTNWDADIAYSANLYSCRGPLIQGLKFKCGVGLEVDKQEVTIAARPDDLISGAPYLAAIADGAFDGATIRRDRVFMSPTLSGGIDGVNLFTGRVSTVDAVGRTSAKITVASDLIVLDYDMPRNLYSATCLHTLYDAGCTLVKASFGTSGTVGAGSSANEVNWTGADPVFVQGSITFTSGANSGVTGTVKAVGVGASLGLMFPLPDAPATGDTFFVYEGCDHTRATCLSKFNNLLNFRGFPYIPPPQIAF